MATYNHSAAFINKKIIETEKKIKDLQKQYAETIETRYASIGRIFAEIFNGCEGFDIANDSDIQIRSFINDLRYLYDEDEYYKRINEQVQLEVSKNTVYLYKKIID